MNARYVFPSSKVCGDNTGNENGKNHDDDDDRNGGNQRFLFHANTLAARERHGKIVPGVSLQAIAKCSYCPSSQRGRPNNGQLQLDLRPISMHVRETRFCR